MTAKKLMNALGVDEAAMAAYKREKGACCECVGDTTFTENWVFYDSGWRSVLLPLKEIEIFKKDYLHLRYDVKFYVTLLFKGVGQYDLTCSFEELDDLMAALTERCPQANQRPVGIYL
jgi:hypothetical protein